MDKVNKTLNATKLLNDKLNTFIDVFTMYYGEELRSEITEKFNQMILVGYVKHDDFKEIIEIEKDKLYNTLIKRTITKYINDDKLIEKLFEALYLKHDLEIYNLSKWINDYKLGKNGRLENALKELYKIFITFIPELTFDEFINHQFGDKIEKLPKYYRNNLDNLNLIGEKTEENFKSQTIKIINFLKKIFPDITEENVFEYLYNTKLQEISDELNKIKVEYNNYIKDNYQVLIDEMDKISEKIKKLENNYFLEFVDELKFLLNEEDLIIFNQVKSGIGNIYDKGNIEIIFGKYFESAGSLEYFCEDADLILCDINESDYRKEIIKSERIKYFKYRGYYLGEDYNSYINNPQILNIWPSKELINQFFDKSFYYQNKIENELYSIIPFFKEVKKNINELGIYSNDFFDLYAYFNSLTCVTPTAIKKLDKFTIYSLVQIYFGLDEFNYLDKNIIHELNHVFESYLAYGKEDEYLLGTGWDYGILLNNINDEKEVNYNLFDDNVKEEKRDFELFSEIINELIAQDITKMMHNQGIYIINTEEDAKIVGYSRYEHARFLLEEFFNLYKREIILSRRNNNIKIIHDKVGKDNFDGMNQLVVEFFNNFSVNEYYELLKDLKIGRETDRVKIYRKMLNRRDNILANMQEYSNNYSQVKY